ncbi:hypothetical protein SAY87_026008 [Trapa incisa]|uniref:Uncharacterized protein n=1 Tax=Trapa incisa TaxID=236973 RepID=A0AAN7GMF0_9MYRT|nr:hypothetical protein SAY87_026008 [Trapa incisa]
MSSAPAPHCSYRLKHLRKEANKIFADILFGNSRSLSVVSTSLKPYIDAYDNDSVMEQLIYVMHKSIRIPKYHQLDNASDSDEFNECGGSKATSFDKDSLDKDSMEFYDKVELALKDIIFNDHVSLIW